ncbi:hypothetical protein MD484_g8026, partial [Candolleomyces efflorescens]
MTEASSSFRPPVGYTARVEQDPLNLVLNYRPSLSLNEPHSHHTRMRILHPKGLANGSCQSSLTSGILRRLKVESLYEGSPDSELSERNQRIRGEERLILRPTRIDLTSPKAQAHEVV